MDNKVKPPVITQELINYLSSIYPDTVPKVSDSDRDIWVNVGAVSVVRHLESIKKRQEVNILNKDIV